MKNNLRFDRADFTPPSFFIKSLPTSNIRIFLLDYVASKY